jgi:hypothetical protein
MFTMPDAIPPSAPVAPMPPEYLWYMDQGDFLDRFGPAIAMAILTSTDLVVQALFKNITVRKWVDLAREDVMNAVNYIAGATIPGLGTISTPIAGMTAALANTVLTTQPTPKEQRTTVKLYFS